MEISTFLAYQEKDTLNVQQVKAFYKAAREKDKEALARILADEPVWNVSPGFPYGGVYSGMAEVYGDFYPNLLGSFSSFRALPDVFIDGGDVVTALGFYKFIKKEGDSPTLVRFSHTWGFTPDGRIKGVWQVADSAQFITPKQS
jgi:ketosteroid isomerase-like protein